MELYPFQQKAVAKLWEQPACLIGDEMGLGKTVTAIALDKKRRQHHKASHTWKTLVIAPLSVLSSWEDHFRIWYPELPVLVIDTKDRNAFVKAIMASSATVYIMHWEAVRLLPELANFVWFHVIGDEIHRIKSRSTQQTQSFKRLTATYKTGLSGTPADNRPDDLWSVLHWLYPKVFASYWRFYNHYVLFKEEYANHGKKYRKIIGTAHADELQAVIEPFYIRRLKEDVLTDLPDKYYTELRVDLYPQQRRAYNTMRDHMIAWVGEHEHEPVAAPMVIAQLIRLQQFACAYGELERVRKRDNYLDVLRLTEPSSKLDAVVELIEGTDGQIVVFSQSKQVVHLLARRLQNKGVPTCTLTGDTPEKDRGPQVEDFQRGKYRVFVGTIGAGGVGITLTATSTVVFIDRAWNPSKNRQAEDRLHRIGQKNAVNVVTVVANGTLDATRNRTIELKWSWIRSMLGDQNG